MKARFLWCAPGRWVTWLAVRGDIDYSQLSVDQLKLSGNKKIYFHHLVNFYLHEYLVAILTNRKQHQRAGGVTMRTTFRIRQKSIIRSKRQNEVLLLFPAGTVPELACKMPELAPAGTSAKCRLCETPSVSTTSLRTWFVEMRSRSKSFPI